MWSRASGSVTGGCRSSTSRAARQPLYNEDGSVAITFNGEIYNFLGLRDELERAGHRFQTRSDTEVHRARVGGVGRALRRAARRHVRVRHLGSQSRDAVPRPRPPRQEAACTTPCSTTACSSSPPSSRLCSCIPDLPRELEPRAVEEYFAFGYVPDPRTILRHAFKLGPGTDHARASRAAVRRRYATTGTCSFRPVAVNSVADTGRELVERLRASVRERLISEVPLGAFLSGGVDSSSIVALMAGLSSEPVNTCSISFGERDYDESEYAALVAQRYRTSHRVEQVDPRTSTSSTSWSRSTTSPTPTARPCRPIASASWRGGR